MLYIVRHGETAWNHERRLQGRVDVPLNVTGLAQARALARYFEDHRVHRVISSPLGRAFTTASLIAQTVRCPIEGHDDLAEIHHGAWQGLTVDEIQRHYGDLWATWNARPSTVRAPGAESLADVGERADRVLRRLHVRLGPDATRPDAPTPLDEDTCLVTHGVMSQVLVCRLTGVDPDAIFTVSQANACINVFEIEEGGAVAKALNFTAHLCQNSLELGVQSPGEAALTGQPRKPAVGNSHEFRD